MKIPKTLRAVFLSLALMTSGGSVSATFCFDSGGYIGDCDLEIDCIWQCTQYCIAQGGNCGYRDSACSGTECHCACEVPPLNP